MKVEYQPVAMPPTFHRELLATREKQKDDTSCDEEYLPLKNQRLEEGLSRPSGGHQTNNEGCNLGRGVFLCLELIGP